VRRAFDDGGYDGLSTEDLLARLVADEAAPWATWRGRGQEAGLSARALRNLLRPFEIEPWTIRVEDGTLGRGYHRSDFEAAWSRYLTEAER
jgi:Protein of unknown function (DUF3631)